MSEWVDKAVILRIGQFHEADLWLKILTQNRGLISVFAFGGAKSIRRFCGCLDIFNTIYCRTKGSRNDEYWNLEEAELIAAPRNLRQYWPRMGIAVNCLKFIEALNISSDTARYNFEILENLRERMEIKADPPQLTPFFFRLRTASVSGFAPAISKCGKCGNKALEKTMFIADEGQIFCNSCYEGLTKEQKRHAVVLSKAALDVLQNVQLSNPLIWEEESLSSLERKNCARMINNFMQYQLGLEWQNGCFHRL